MDDVSLESALPLSEGFSGHDWDLGFPVRTPLACLQSQVKIISFRPSDRKRTSSRPCQHMVDQLSEPNTCSPVQEANYRGYLRAPYI